MKTRMFFLLTKVNSVLRTVSGIATAEVPDQDNEICDYESTKPLFQAWSEMIEKASGGKSLGNVREMHGAKAVGKLTKITFNDDDKAIEIEAKIVDDETWNKIEEGVLTGFSQGGAYVKTWKDPDNKKLTRFTAKPSEMSVVDNPCLTVASFEYVKADGTSEMRKMTGNTAAPADVDDTDVVEQGWKAKDGSFHKTKQGAIDHNAKAPTEALTKRALAAAAAIEAQLDDETPAYWEAPEFEAELVKGFETDEDATKEANELAKKQFSDDKRAKLADEGKALPDGSFPIESKGDLANAITAFGRAKDPEKAKAHIMERAKALGATAMLPKDWDVPAAKKFLVIGEGDQMLKLMLKNVELAKGLGEVGRIACMLQDLGWLQRNLEFEAVQEEDGSPQPAHLMEIMKELGEFLCNLCEEETQELVGGDDEEDAIEEKAAGLSSEGALALSKVLADSDKDFPAALNTVLEKAGARHSAADKGRLAAMDTHMKKMGGYIEKMTKSHGEMSEAMTGLGAAEDTPEKAAAPADMKKMADLEANNAALSSTVEQLVTTLETLQKRFAIVERQPLQGGKRPAVHAVQKGNEVPEPGTEPVDASEADPIPNGLSPEEARRLSYR